MHPWGGCDGGFDSRWPEIENENKELPGRYVDNSILPGPKETCI